MRLFYKSFALSLLAFAAALPASAAGLENSTSSPGRVTATRQFSKQLKKTRAEADNDIISEPAGEMAHFSRDSEGYAISDFGFLSILPNRGFASDVVFGDDNKVFLRNPNSFVITNTYIAGDVMPDGSLSFALPQFFAVVPDAVSGDELRLYAFRYEFFEDPDTGEIQTWLSDDQTVTFAPSEEGGYDLVLPDDEMLGVGFEDGTWTAYGDWTISLRPFSGQLVTLPDGLTPEIWGCHYENTGHLINMAFDGDDVYFQGLFNKLPEAWAKGTIVDGVVKIPTETYLGIEKGGNHYTYLIGCATEEYWDDFFEDWATVVVAQEFFEMAYDAESRTMDAGENFIVFNAGKGGGNLYFLGYLMNPTIKYQGDAAPARPLDPIIGEWDYYAPEEAFPGGIYMDLPSADVNGNLLDTSHLYYRMFLPGDQLYTFPSDLYFYFPSPGITRVPYNFSYGYDVYVEGSLHTFTINYDPEHPDMSVVGFQLVYEGENGDLCSSIVYTDGSVGINPVGATAATPVDVKWFNISGQRISNPIPGLNIKIETFDDGSTQSSKIIMR